MNYPKPTKITTIDENYLFHKKIKSLIQNQFDNTYRVVDIQCGRGLHGRTTYIIYTGTMDEVKILGSVE